MKKIMISIMISVLMLVAAACGKENNGHGEHEAKKEGSHEEHSKEKESHEGHETGSHDSGTKVKWSAADAESGKEAEIEIKITSKSGKPVNEYEINHEKKLHLIVVSKDLSYFNHIHPEFKGDGTFTVKNTFPAGGEYKLIADYIPAGGKETTQTKWLDVKGEKAETKRISPDKKLEKKAEGRTVELSFEGGAPKAGEETGLTFTINENGKPVTDLEQYLGAVGHVVILSKDTDKYLHVHPLDENAKGPDAKFATSFPEKGVYKIWGQFQQDGELFIADFTVEVE